MQDFTFKTSKGSIFESMMKRPSTAKLIKEALASPVGSTSRMKAKKVFSIMSKLNEKNDGAGGPGGQGNIMAQMGLSQEPTQRRMTEEPKVPKGMVVFNKIPKANITYSFKPLVNDGGGGPGYDGKGGYTGSSISDYLSSIGKDASYSARSALAAQSGISNYAGTADQNTKLLNSLRSGASPDPVAASKPTTPKYTDAYGQGISIADTPQIYTDIYGNKSLTPPTPFTAPTIKPTPVTYPKNKWGKEIKPSKPEKLASAVWSDIKSVPSKVWGAVKNIYSDENRDKVEAYMPFTPASIQTEEGTKSQQEAIARIRARKDAEQNKQANTEQINKPDVTVKAEEVTVEEPTMSSKDLEKNSVTEKIPVKIIPTEDGKGIYLEVSEGAQGGQCGRFVNNYLGKSIFGDSFEQKMSNANVTDPIAGDVVIIAGGDYGHVAVIESINPDGTLNIVGSNADGVSEKITRNTIDASSASGFYRPGGPTNLSIPQWEAASAVSENMGASGYALENNPLPIGQELQDRVWADYRIKETQNEILELEKEGVQLPKNVTEYIKASDTALKDIDEKIKTYTNDIMANTDMSNPANIAIAKAQLGYLYTLRGRQNQTYVGYLNDAVEQHQAMYDGIVAKYDTDMKNAQRDIDNGTADYERMSESLADAYEELKNAPELALKMRALELEVIQREDEIANGPTEKDALLSDPGQLKTIKELGTLIDADGMIVPGADVSKFIAEVALDPNSTLIEPTILRLYANALNKTLNAPEGTEAGQVSATYKKSILADAIDQVSTMHFDALQAGDDATAANLLNMLTEFSFSQAGLIAKDIDEEGSKQLEEAIGKIAPVSFWTRAPKEPIDEDEFIEEATKGEGTIDESLAKAIYAVFKRYVDDDGEGNPQSPSEAVKALLNNLNSTENRADPNTALLSPNQFAWRWGNLLANYFANSKMEELYAAKAAYDKEKEAQERINR